MVALLLLLSAASVDLQWQRLPYCRFDRLLQPTLGDRAVHNILLQHRNVNSRSCGCPDCT